MAGMRYDRLAVILTLFMLAMFAIATWPEPVAPGHVAGEVKPDGYDYAYGDRSLLQGSYIVTWDGTTRPAIYPPGMSVLLMPAVAIGGVESAIWIVYLMYLALGILAAVIAARLGGPLAAPIGLLFTLAPIGAQKLSGIVMSDLSTAVLLVLEVALLAIWPDRRSALFAGLLAGFLVCMRFGNAGYILAGAAALTALSNWRQDTLWYGCGAIVPLALLVCFLWSVYGSPLTTGYEVGWVGSQGGDTLPLFSVNYVWHNPDSDGALLGGFGVGLHLPSLLVYPCQLAGLDAFVTLPLVGIFGFVALIKAFRLEGPMGAYGRFGLVTIIVTLVTYLPYYYQSGRFLLPAAVILSVGAAVWLGQRLTAHSAKLSPTG